jgi:hypothetical protein
VVRATTAHVMPMTASIAAEVVGQTLRAMVQTILEKAFRCLAGAVNDGGAEFEKTIKNRAPHARPRPE